MISIGQQEMLWEYSFALLRAGSQRDETGFLTTPRLRGAGFAGKGLLW